MIEDLINHGTFPSIEHLLSTMMQNYNSLKENGRHRKEVKNRIDTLQSVDFTWIMI